MAIYRCEFKIISRGSGHRACAAAAYRAGEKIMDERYGDTHDYTRKSGVAASFILAPENAPDWMSNRTELWNAVEAVERRKDAQLCREVLLSLPHELTDDQREALVRQFVRDQFVSKGMVADVNIHTHSPSGDERNDHAHILLTTRTLTASSFGPKERSWNSRDFVHETREMWAKAQNREFEQLGLDIRVDHRSLADQEIDREPEPKLGPHATEALRNGEPEKADRVIQHHDAVMERNAERERLKEQREVIDLALERMDRATGTREAEEMARLAQVHVQQMRQLQVMEADKLKTMRREQMAELRQAVREARAEHAAYRESLQPGFFRRLGEIVALKGRAKQEERNEALRSFKSGQDTQLNALRAEHRQEFAARKAEFEASRDDLRQMQREDRDRLIEMQRERQETERTEMQRHRAQLIEAERQLDDQSDERRRPAPDQADQHDMPQIPSERPQDGREGLSEVWERHAPPNAPDAPPEGRGRDDEDGERGSASSSGHAGAPGTGTSRPGKGRERERDEEAERLRETQAPSPSPPKSGQRDTKARILSPEEIQQQRDEAARQAGRDPFKIADPDNLPSQAPEERAAAERRQLAIRRKKARQARLEREEQERKRSGPDLDWEL